MSPSARIDRRRSNVSIQDLQRRLRDADEERFHLEAALAHSATQWLEAIEHRPPPPSRRVTVGKWLPAVVVTVVCLAGGLSIWLTDRDGDQPAMPEVRADMRPRAFDRMVQPATMSLPDVTIEQRGDELRGTAPLRLTHVRRAIRRESASTKPARRQQNPPPGKPHPLHPGEFGRSLPLN